MQNEIKKKHMKIIPKCKIDMGKKYLSKRKYLRSL